MASTDSLVFTFLHHIQPYIAQTQTDNSPCPPSLNVTPAAFSHPTDACSIYLMFATLLIAAFRLGMCLGSDT